MVYQEYDKLLQKYRQEAIQHINSYYDSIEKELLLELTSVSQIHLSMAPKIEEKLELFGKYMKMLEKEETALSAIININVNDEVTQIEKIFSTIKVLMRILQEQKSRFKGALPRLEPSELGKVRIISNAQLPA